jgi:hypothetical protein
MLRVLRLLYGNATPPFILTVDPYGSRPYEGAPFVYDARHYGAMKRHLAPYANHIHYMMDSELFLRELDNLYLWVNGAKQSLGHFTLVYLDGSHDPEIVRSEVERLLPRVIPGGFLIVDDTDWFDGAVRQRLDQIAATRSLAARHNGKQSVVEIPR